MQKSIVRIAFFSFFLLLSIVGFSQEQGTILIISNENAIILIDGENKGKIVAGTPFKVSIEEGEHYLQVKSQRTPDQEKSEIFETTAGKQKVLKIDFETDSVEKEEANSNPNSELNAVDIAQLNFNIPGAVAVAAWVSDHPNENHPQSPIYYYAFEKGDVIVLDLEMTNKKGTNLIEVSKYPSGQVVYSDKAFAQIRGLKIVVKERGIYRIAFATNHAFDRNVKVDLKRIPETLDSRGFNSTVKYVKQYRTQVVQPVQKFTINGGSNATFGGGKSRVTLPIQLPPGTIQWYYEFSASRDKEKLAQIASTFDLAGDLTKLFDRTGVLDFGIDLLTAPPGSDYCDVYLMGYEDSRLFEAKEGFRRMVDPSRENFQSGVVRVQCCPGGTWYLGFKNPSTFYGVDIAVEVVAVLENSRYVMEEEDSLNR